MWNKTKFSYQSLKPFGCLTYFLKPQIHQQFKLNPKGEKGLFLGYLNDFSTYIILNSSGRIIITREVKFQEEEFPGLAKENDDLDVNPFENVLSRSSLILPPSETQATQDETQIEDIISETDSPVPNQNEISSTISTRNILNHDRRGNPISLNLVESYFSEPKYYHQAIHSSESEKWNLAIKKELANMEDHQVWEVREQQPEDKLLNCTWVSKIKKDSDNEAMEYKARLCVQGFNQTEGLDYFTTFAPTGKLTSLRLLMSFALDNNLKFHQIDIKSAFLNAPLSEHILLRPPPGVIVKEHQVV